MIIVLIILGLLILTNWGSFFVPSAGQAPSIPKDKRGPTRMLFEKQFRALVKIGPGVWVGHLRPPDELLKPGVPLVFIAGGTPNVIALREMFYQLWLQGHEVYFGDIPGGETEAYLRLMEHYGIKNAIAVTHSAGNLVAVKMAKSWLRNHHPQVFSTVVMVEPSGAIPKDGVFELGRRVIESVEDENRAEKEVEWPQSNRWRRGQEFYFRFRILQTLWQLYAIAKADILEGVRFLKRLDISVFVVQGENDHLYPLREVEATLRGEVDGFDVVPNGRHQGLPLWPTETVAFLEERVMPKVTVANRNN